MLGFYINCLFFTKYFKCFENYTVCILFYFYRIFLINWNAYGRKFVNIIPSFFFVSGQINMKRDLIYFPPQKTHQFIFSSFLIPHFIHYISRCPRVLQSSMSIFRADFQLFPPPFLGGYIFLITVSYRLPANPWSWWSVTTLPGSTCLQSGKNTPAVSKFLGHRSPQTSLG